MRKTNYNKKRDQHNNNYNACKFSLQSCTKVKYGNQRSYYFALFVKFQNVHDKIACIIHFYSIGYNMMYMENFWKFDNP